MRKEKNNLPQKVLLIGATGQLGTEARRTLAPLGTVQAIASPQLDLTRPDDLRSCIRNERPDLIFNASAYTAVDQAESEDGSKDADLVNVQACQVMAEEAFEVDALLIHFSTDYVFDGNKGSPYTEDDRTNPLNVYGRTKLEGERAIQQVGGKYFIFRTSWVYSKRKTSFTGKVLDWIRESRELRIVDDQIGSPTWAAALAITAAQACLVARLRGDKWVRANRGIYHLGGRGICTRKQWVEAIIALDPHKDEHVVERVLPAKTAEFSNPAQRPLNTALDCSSFEKIFGLYLQEWRHSLTLCLADSRYPSGKPF